MLASEFIPEMGALIRSLEQKVRTAPELRHEDVEDALDYIERALVILIALDLNLRKETK